MNVVDLEQVRASGRAPRRPVVIDHAARAWALPPEAAAKESARYAQIAHGLSCRISEPSASLWLSLSRTYSARAQLYATVAAFRSRGRAA